MSVIVDDKKNLKFEAKGFPPADDRYTITHDYTFLLVPKSDTRASGYTYRNKRCPKTKMKSVLSQRVSSIGKSAFLL